LKNDERVVARFRKSRIFSPKSTFVNIANRSLLSPSFSLFHFTSHSQTTLSTRSLFYLTRVSSSVAVRFRSFQWNPADLLSSLFVYYFCSTLASTLTALLRLSTHSLRSTSRFHLISSYSQSNKMSTSSCPFTTDTAPQCWGHRGVCYSHS